MRGDEVAGLDLPDDVGGDGFPPARHPRSHSARRPSGRPRRSRIPPCSSPSAPRTSTTSTAPCATAPKPRAARAAPRRERARGRRPTCARVITFGRGIMPGFGATLSRRRDRGPGALAGQSRWRRRGDRRRATRAPGSTRDRRTLATWLWRLPVLAALGGAGYGLVEVWRVHFDKIAPRGAAGVRAPRLACRAAERVRCALGRRRRSPSPASPAWRCASPSPIAGARGRRPRAPTHLAPRSAASAPTRACLLDLNLDVEAIAFAFNHRTDRPETHLQPATTACSTRSGGARGERPGPCSRCRA
jgi:hypothetical protein